MEGSRSPSPVVEHDLKVDLGSGHVCVQPTVPAGDSAVRHVLARIPFHGERADPPGSDGRVAVPVVHIAGSDSENLSDTTTDPDCKPVVAQPLRRRRLALVPQPTGGTPQSVQDLPFSTANDVPDSHDGRLRRVREALQQDAQQGIPIDVSRAMEMVRSLAERVGRVDLSAGVVPRETRRQQWSFLNIPSCGQRLQEIVRAQCRSGWPSRHRTFPSRLAEIICQAVTLCKGRCGRGALRSPNSTARATRCRDGWGSPEGDKSVEIVHFLALHVVAPTAGAIAREQGRVARQI